MKKAAALFLALLIGLFSILPCFAIDDPDFVAAAEKTKKPLVYLTDIKGKAGSSKKVSATLMFAHAKGFTSGDLVIQYNPYMLEYAGFVPSATMGNSNVYINYTEKTGPDVLDIYGNIAHEVYISLLHMNEFDKDLDTCEIGTVYFKPIGGGECPLELTAMSFDVGGEDAKCEVRSATAKISGEKASEWDYTAITSAYLEIPDDSPYVVVKPKLSKFPVWAIIVLVIAAIAVFALVFLFVIKGKNYVADDGETPPKK
ncbi:MAG: hypothetical protein IK118_07250 [Clostridia bacterium]|nr:hypothetical protein [Clostridia bacterium]MBR5428127.1 hypothetical protein [Clostridia bacterium]